jgi:adenosylcobinamide-GDP ribazoletransferase
VPAQASALAALALGLIPLLVALGVASGAVAVVLLAAAFGLMARLCIRQIGGQTGDVLGALEQIGEIAVLLVAAAAMNTLR